MVIVKFDFICVLCNQKDDFYIMPQKVKVGNNDFRNSLTNYQMQCKKCGKNYLLKIDIKAL